MMRVLAVLVLACFAATVHSQEFEYDCPVDESFYCIDGFYPYEPDCGGFIECAFCQVRFLSCQPGTHFHAASQTCKHPALAGCDPSMASNVSAFCVYRNSQVDGPANPLVLNQETLNYGGYSPYDRSTGVYRGEKEGVYFFHLSAGAAPNTPVDLSLNISGVPANLLRDGTSHDYDVLSRDIMVDLPDDTVLVASITGGTTVHSSNGGKQTTVLGFRLDEFMTNTVGAFYAYKEASETKTGTLIYEQVLANVGNRYSPDTGFFTAPAHDVYLFTSTTGVTPGGDHRSRFYSSRQGYLSELYRGNGDNNGFDTISTAIIAEMEVGETMSINLQAGEAVARDNILAFSGFRYDPSNATAQSWYVQSNTVRTATGADMDPLNFQLNTLNLNNLYNTVNHRVDIAITGYYYITITSGVTSFNPCDVHLVVNDGVDRVEAHLTRTASYNTLPDSMRKDIILHLRAGNTLRLILKQDSSQFSDADKQSVFGGFLLFESAAPIFAM